MGSRSRRPAHKAYWSMQGQSHVTMSDQVPPMHWSVCSSETAQTGKDFWVCCSTQMGHVLVVGG